RRDRTGTAFVDPKRLRAFALAAEFRPLLRSQGAVHAAVRSLKLSRHLIVSGVPVRLPRSGITPGGVSQAGVRSRMGSGCNQFAVCFDRFFGLAGEAQDEVSRF